MQHVYYYIGITRSRYPIANNDDCATSARFVPGGYAGHDVHHDKLIVFLYSGHARVIEESCAGTLSGGAIIPSNIIKKYYTNTTCNCVRG